MKFLKYLYQHINILSVDVAAGALISSLFFGQLLHVSISWATVLALALTVWVIYTLDHLRDAISIPKVASSDRHRFHQKHFRLMTVALLVVALVDFVLVWKLPAVIRNAGLMLASAVLAYLILQRYLKFLKEFFVAFLYTLGILLPSLSRTGVELLPIHYLIFAKFFVTALMNLLLFSLFDHEEDRHHQQHSFVTWFGPASTRYGITFLGLVNILTGTWLWRFDAGVAAVFIIMNLLLLALLLFRKALRVNNWYRILGDAVFFVPGFYLL